MGVALAGRRRLIWLLVAAVVLASIAFGVVRALTAGAADEETKAAETATVDKGVVTTEVATTGTLQAAQTRSLSFSVDGTVETVTVRAGTTVTAGQVLATVDDTDAAEAVDDAQDALDEARDNLDEAEENAAAAGATTAATTGCDVAAAYTTGATASPTVSAMPSATAAASPSSPATATASASATSARTSKAASPTTTPGAGRGGTTGGSSGSCGSSSGGSSGSSGSGSSGSGSGGGQQGGGSSSGNDAILSAQQRVNKAEVTLDEAEEALDGATITAPIAGKILTVSGKVGSQVSSGSAFITLADVYDMQISADFPEADADHLAVRQKAVITLADRAGETFDATVVQVDPVGTSDGTLTRFGVVLSFDDAPEELLVGQSANVRVTTGTKKDVLRVPSTAVHDVSGTTGTVLAGGSPRQVKLGLRGDQYTEITSGVAEGDVVAKSW
ncbi:efflux RND transporter periplasmic adaptor subunit [Actinoplanes sp. NPDC023936]|uniref:efflux RND transporter periplasmic adaptor subunit n=1 Tax=Actinoplanes sp. NPDC023936 TaxID=3154910 RepID=UPI0033CE0072